MGIAEITQGKGWKNFMAKLYGLGASVVIIGALFKIQHWPGAGIMLTIGLGTEAIIFFFSAFEPQHEEVDWSLVYPELAGMEEEESAPRKMEGTVTQELDKMLSDAKIGPELIDSLGSGLRSLGENTARLADISDASVATNEYVKNMQNASESAGGLAQSYSRTADAMNALSSSANDVKVFGDQMSSAGKNLEALNAMYELQLQDSSAHLKATGKMYDGINEVMANLNSTLADTQKYKEQIAQLAQNLSALNNVYGNMLSAMNAGSRS
jgi:gliding motility-associated protein GldL